MGGFRQLGQRPNPTESVQVRIERAIARLKEKGVENDHCPRCTVFDWNVDILEIPVNSAMAPPFASFLGPLDTKPDIYGQRTNRPASGILSVLSLVCKNCGYSIFHNMNMLDR